MDKAKVGKSTPATNQVVREVAAEMNVPLVDTVKVLEDASPHGIIGKEVMLDGCHPNPKGAELVGKAISSKILEMRLLEK